MPAKDRTVAVAIVGPGKIVRDQHVPAIAGSGVFEIVASVSRSSGLPNYPVFASVEDLLASDVKVDAVAICTPPQVREDIAHVVIAAGVDVLLEKPPAMTPSAFEAIRRHASERGVVLFATWHSRFAPMVEPARTLIAAHGGIARARITWREDAHHWHPGQTWLWEPGGLGVFDPGINALSIFTRLTDARVVVRSAEFDVPANCHSPVAARLEMVAGDAPVAVDFDFRQKGEQSWDIHIVCADGTTVDLGLGGSRLSVDGQTAQSAPEAEYPGIYRRFAELLQTGESDADGTPLQLVADAFMIAKCNRVEDFHP